MAPSCDRTGAPRSDRDECIAESGSTRDSLVSESEFQLRMLEGAIFLISLLR